VSAGELAKMKFNTLTIGGVFGKLLGNPYIPFYLMIYGARFNGKSSVAMLLANVLAKKGLKVLYVSNEEGVKGSLQEKLLRLNITAPIDFVEDYTPSQFKSYDAVFLDSTQTVGIKPDDFKALKKRFPNTSFILVFKANKDGTSKGSSDWGHDCDAIMHIENRSATMEKNRFPNGSNETIKIF
jgi:predicted ATP-dependent serine protease